MIMPPFSPTLGSAFTSLGYDEVILPSIWEQGPFIEKGGGELPTQMWSFEDKAGRPVCLIPEATALVQEMWDKGWSKSMPKPYRIFYVSRCFRYENPQAGRQREFTQLGVEILGGRGPEDREECIRTMLMLADSFGIDYAYKDGVKRGLGYYTEDGFELECPVLGAQKQICGGGRYPQGIGFAFGIERTLLARKMQIAAG